MKISVSAVFLALPALASARLIEPHGLRAASSEQGDSKISPLYEIDEIEDRGAKFMAKTDKDPKDKKEKEEKKNKKEKEEKKEKRAKEVSSSKSDKESASSSKSDKERKVDSSSSSSSSKSSKSSSSSRDRRRRKWKRHHHRSSSSSSRDRRNKERGFTEDMCCGHKTELEFQLCLDLWESVCKPDAFPSHHDEDFCEYVGVGDYGCSSSSFDSTKMATY